MKNKQFVILICTFLIVIAIPVSGFNIKVKDKNNLIMQQYFEDYPGFMNTPYPKFNTPQISQKNPKSLKMLPTFENNIIDIILQLNESMILNYLENLTAFGPRVTGTPECYAAGDYIFNEFESMGLDVSFHDWNYGGYTDRNVEATLYGTNNPNDEIFVICAHFDTVPGSPGADDDGSGVAAVLSAANIISQYEVKYTIRFITFSGEEEGLFGSYKYTEEAYVNGDNIVGVLNADMIGYAMTTDGGNKITIRQNEASVWLTEFISNVSQLYHDYINLEIIPQFDTYGLSDHYSFWQFGYDAIQYREYETNPYFHTTNDIIENMNITYFLKCSKLALATLAELTKPLENNLPPNQPNITGPATAEEGKELEFRFNSDDPDYDDVKFHIDWNDGNTLTTDFHPSGADVWEKHTWATKGTYTIKVIAEDVFGLNSTEATFTITITKNKPTQISPILNFITNYPNLFPILQQLLLRLGLQN